MHGETTQASGRELRVGDVFADHRIEGVLGRGGMGVVYRATDMRLNRSVALKVIKPELSGDDDFRRRFRRESEHAASIRQPNVVTIYQAGDANGLLYVTMDLIDGTDLRGVIGQHGRLDLATAGEITAQLASALDAAHGRGLVHRDVKPANVLVANGSPMHVFLTDFGLTKRTSSQSGITKTGLFVGTLDYAAPEQIQGWPVDARADVYALGCVLFEMLTGHPPFRRDNDYATLYAHMTEPPPRVSASGVPAAFDGVIARALAKNPDERYPSAGDLARAARAAAEGDRPDEPERTVATGPAAPSAPAVVEPPTEVGVVPATAAAPPPAPPAPPAYQPPAPKPRNPWPVVALIVGILVAGGIAAAVLMSGGGDDGDETTPVAQQQQQQQQPSDRGQVSPPAVEADLRDDVLEIEEILALSAKGRAHSQDGDYDAAATNRQRVLARVNALEPHPDLRASHALLRSAVDASLEANYEHAACGCTAEQPSDGRASELKQDFVDEFNPIARDILGRSYDADDI